MAADRADAATVSLLSTSSSATLAAHGQTVDQDGSGGKHQKALYIHEDSKIDHSFPQPEARSSRATLWGTITIDIAILLSTLALLSWIVYLAFFNGKQVDDDFERHLTVLSLVGRPNFIPMPCEETT